MPTRIKAVIYALALGVSLGSIGVLLMGYIAAIAIPAEWVLWFGNNDLAILSINFVSQLIAFGIITIVTGTVLGRISAKWLLNSALCYVGFLFYMSVGIALVYETEISNPYVGFGDLDLPAIIFLPLCLMVSTWLTAKTRFAHS